MILEKEFSNWKKQTMNFIKNVYFWLKLNLIVKPTKFIDERTNPKFGYDAYKFCKTWSKVFAFVLFPVFFIVFVSTAAGAVYNVTWQQTGVDGAGFYETTFAGFELLHSNPMFLAALWSIVSIMIVTALLWFGQFWFAKFKPVVVEETAHDATHHHAGVHPKVTHSATATTVKYETKPAKKTKAKTKTSKKSSKKTSKTK